MGLGMLGMIGELGRRASCVIHRGRGSGGILGEMDQDSVDVRLWNANRAQWFVEECLCREEAADAE